MKKIIDNVRVFDNKTGFFDGYVVVEDGMISGVCNGRCEQKGVERYDGLGGYLIPGLIDMHLHGAMGADFCDADEALYHTICEYEARNGITTLCPATMTLPQEELLNILRTIRHYSSEDNCARIAGINMEGPFISEVRCGAQDKANIKPCDYRIFEDYYEAAGGLLKVLGVAPEASDSETFIQQASKLVHVSLAHSDASYEEAKRAIEVGADHIVHLYNGMQDMLHREPGIVGAAIDSEGVSAELICDGIHIHPTVLGAAIRLLGDDRVIVISDSMRATGLHDGEYLLGGLRTCVKGRTARLVSNGALAGSVTNVADGVRYLVNEVRIPLGRAVRYATVNPAVKLGIFDEVGSIEVGKRADLLLWDEELNTRAVMLSGEFLLKE